MAVYIVVITTQHACSMCVRVCWGGAEGSTMMHSVQPA